MRLSPFIPPVIITTMMAIGFVITITFQNQVPYATQQVMAQEMPFMSFPTSGNLVVSFGSFLLVTLFADVVMFVPLYLLGRRGR